MSRRRSSLKDTKTAVNRGVDSSYDTVKIVADNIEVVVEVGNNIDNSLKYLGGSTAPPTTRLDGSPIEDGDYFFNTDSNALVYFNLEDNLWFEVDPADVLNARDLAISAKDAAEVSEINAAESASNAAISESNASASELNAKTSEVNAGSSSSNAASYASSANSSKSAASDSATSASNSAFSANADKDLAEDAAVTATSKASAAGVSESNASASATSANASANSASTSESNAATSESNANTSASNANTSAIAANSYADSAETSAINASSSASNASTSEANANTAAATATTKADEASGYASAASLSETNAASSESNAATSASNASTSEANALIHANNATAAFDNFDDKYLGSKTSNPSLDNDGDVLQVGSSYWNSVADELRYWNGAAWESPEATATQAANSATSSASNAATSESNAATSASTATTKATEASNSATSASGSATIATDKAAEAATSEENARLSEEAALASEQNTAVYASNAKVMSKTEFFALAEKRIRDNAGSGFAEWGKQPNNQENVNEGLWTVINSTDFANSLMLGRRDASASQAGTSKTGNAIVNVNGVSATIAEVVRNSNDNVQILFPDAPDGTETYNSATGDYVQYATPTLAFAAETDTNKVITSRQDYVFLEVWHEKISDKGVVYPLGNVQYGANSYEGITLNNSLVAQGYSAFGEWDTSTTGYGVAWDSLTDEQKTIFLQDEENNIYNDDGELIQVRYRIRVVKGFGDDWDYVNPFNLPDDTNTVIRYKALSTVSARGLLTTNVDYVTSAGYGFGKYNNRSTFNNLTEKDLGIGTTLDGRAESYDSTVNIIPIALVQRRNQGGYEPSLNPNGCARFFRNDASFNENDWYEGAAKKPTSVADCFDFGTTLTSGNVSPFVRPNRANIATGSTGRPDDKAYDAIYASDVQDLRMSSRRRPLKEIREEAKRKAIAGEIRGFEGVPCWSPQGTVFDTSNGSAGSIRFQVNGSFYQGRVGEYLWAEGTNGNLQVLQVVSVSGDTMITDTTFDRVQNNTVWAGIKQQHSQANPTWTDIIGDPARIAATFPDGVEGQWIPITLPYNDIPANRKILGNPNVTYTLDNGNSWVSTTIGYDSILNTSGDVGNVLEVRLMHYETQAHFTQDDDNSVVFDLGGAWAGNNNNSYNGNILASSLTGKVNTGSGLGSVATDLLVQGYTTSTQPSNADFGKITDVDGREPYHNMIELDANSPVVKTLDYLSVENGVAKLCYAYKEMVYDANADTRLDFNEISVNTSTSYVVGETYWFNHPEFIKSYGKAYRCIKALGATPDVIASLGELPNGDLHSSSGGAVVVFFEEWNGNGWGDNNQFSIVDNQSTMLDDNAQTILIGTASFKTQYFIDESD